MFHLQDRRHSGKRLPSPLAGLGTCDVSSAILTATLPTAASAGGMAGGAGRPKPRTVRIEEAQSPPSKTKQASIRIHEAGTKTKIKVRIHQLAKPYLHML